MTAKTAQFITAFDEFWRFVAEAEQDVRKNGYLGRLAPCCYGDPWDERFAAAYEAIRLRLRKLCKTRYYAAPAGLAFFPGPFTAENAHQALMYFLNPPGELYGEKGLLDSAEYKAIKEAAMAELQQIDDARVAKSRRRPCSMSAKQRSALIELRGFILDHHFPKNKPFQSRTLTSEEIQKYFGWSQSTVSRKMRKLFKTRKASAYAVLFSTHSAPKGYRQRFEDATLSVDALWVDRTPYSEDDE